MSILIKGMQMPESCRECRFYDINNACFATNYFVLLKKGEKKPKWCPLVEVPKHEWRDMNVEQPTEGTLAIVGWWTEYGWWHAETGVYGYDEEGEDLRWSYNNDLVTHWMPLPDPPKGKEE